MTWSGPGAERDGRLIRVIARRAERVQTRLSRSAGYPDASRLLIGTGKYKDFAETRAAVEASGAQIVTVAIRRANIGQNRGEPSLLDVICGIHRHRFTFLGELSHSGARAAFLSHANHFG